MYGSDVLYRYQAGGVEYFSNQYSLTDFGTMGWFAGERRIAMRYGDGMNTDCFVNPSDPSQAVLVRGTTAPMLWFAVPATLLLVLMICGVGGQRPRSGQDKSTAELAGFTLGFTLSAAVILAIAGDLSADLRQGIWTLGETGIFVSLPLFKFIMARGAHRAASRRFELSNRFFRGA